MLRLRRIAAVLLLASLLLAAQAQERPNTAPQLAQPDAAQPETEQQIRKREESQRILGVMPMFAVTNRRKAQPLTPPQKFHLFVKSAFDPFVFAAVGIQAGISQGDNQFPGYGQGAEGFGKRYGAALGDSVSSNFFSNFFYPVLLKQDPRYFRRGQGSVKRRIGYALAQELVAHTDKGGHSFNFANVMLLPCTPSRGASRVWGALAWGSTCLLLVVAAHGCRLRRWHLQPLLSRERPRLLLDHESCRDSSHLRERRRLA